MTAAQGLPAIFRSLFLQAENLLVENPPTAWLPFSCWREQGAGQASILSVPYTPPGPARHWAGPALGQLGLFSSQLIDPSPCAWPLGGIRESAR